MSTVSSESADPRGGVPVRMCQSSGSTQDDVRRLLRTGELQAPFAIATTDQRGGRGRLQRSWVTPPGDGLAITLAHAVPLAPARRSWCSLVVGLGVLGGLAQARQALGLAWPARELGLKWPNDLHTPQGSKVGGILVETEGPSALLVGIGLNLRGPVRAADGAEVAGAVALLPQNAPPLAPEQVEALAEAIARSVERELRLLEEAGGDADASGQRARYGEVCVTVGQEVRVDVLGQAPLAGGSALTDDPLRGIACGIDARGRLEIRDAAGQVHAVDVGDVRHVRRYPLRHRAGAEMGPPDGGTHTDDQDDQDDQGGPR